MDELSCAAALGEAAGVVDAVLCDVATLLAALARDPDFADAVDLHSLPLTDADRDRLRQWLGRGEIEASFDLAGPTRIHETAFAGVWWVCHADAQGRAVLEQIVVARVPALLLAHPDDIAAAARRLNSTLDGVVLRETIHD